MSQQTDDRPFGLSAQERENKIIGEVLQKISDDHPKRDDLMQTVKNDVAGIRQFIIDKNIVSLKSRDNLKVIPTPLFMRGIYSVGGFHGAPPLDPNAEAEYWVTPIDPKTAQFIGLAPFAGGATPGPVGNLGRNTFRLPGVNNFNVNFQKSVHIAERVSMRGTASSTSQCSR